MTAKLSAEEKTPLRQAWSDYLVSDEYQRAAQTAVFSDAMFQSFAYAFAAGSLRSSAQVREAEARWEALKPFVNSSGRADNVLHQIRAEMARLEKERTA